MGKQILAIDAVMQLSDFEWTIICAARRIEALRDKDNVYATPIKQLTQESAQELQAVVNHPFVTQNSEMMEAINSLWN